MKPINSSCQYAPKKEFLSAYVEFSRFTASKLFWKCQKGLPCLIGVSLLMLTIPLTNASSNSTNFTTTPALAAFLTALRTLDSVRFSHQSEKVVIGITARLSHSTWYLCFGVVAGGFWANVKMSEFSSVFFSCRTNEVGSATVSPSS